MRSRGTIRVKGDVQEAGYRSHVQQSALKLKLTGYVENLDDGSVRIVCEGERESIVELCKEIRVKDEFINVTSIRKRFSEHRGEFRGFVIRTGDLASEMFQGYATAGKYFRSLGKKIDDVGEKVDDVGEKVECVGSKVGCVKDEVKSVGKGATSMHDDMNERFDKLDGSYGEFAGKMDLLDDHIKEIRDDFRLLVDHVVHRKRKGKRSANLFR